MNKFVGVMVIILFIGTRAISQHPVWTPIELEEAPEIISLHTDTLGFLWGLAEDGLYKYDGYTISKKAGPSEIQSKFISADFASGDQFLLGTQNGQMEIFNPYSESIIDSFTSTDSIPITFVVCPDLKINCAIISYGNGLIWKTNERDTFLTTDNLLVSNEVYAAVQKNASLILATDQGIQFLTGNGENINSEILDSKDGLKDIIVTSILINNDKLWVSNFDDLVSSINIESKEIKSFPFAHKSRINDLQLIEGNQIVACRDDGLYFLIENQWIKKYPEENSSKVKCVSTDEEGNLWISSENSTLLKASLLFQTLTISTNQIQAIQKIGDNIWIGNETGLFLYNGNQLLKILLNQNITCIVHLNSLIFIGTYSSGVYVLNENGESIGHLDSWENHSDQSILSILATQNRVYISSLTGVIYADYTEQTNKVVFDTPTSLNSLIGQGYIYQMVKDGDKIYFATDQQGLKILENGSINHNMHFADETELGSVYSMALDQKGVLWLSSSEGNLGYLKNGSVVKRKNLKNINDIYSSLITMEDGNLLMIRNSSVDILDPVKNHLMYFNRELGIIDSPPFLNAYSIDGSVVWFAHDKKIYTYKSPESYKIHPEVSIDKVFVNLTEIRDREKFRQWENNFQFVYTGSWMTDPEKLSYQYKLDGFDNQWRISKDRIASYPKLEPGKYTFRLRASENTQFSDEPEKDFSFTIKKTFYNTLWFWALIGFIALYSFRRWRNHRKKQLRQEEELKKQQIESQLISLQSQLNPHFLFNSFNTLIGLIEENPEKGILFTEKLTDFYRSINEFAKNDLIPLKDELKLLETYIHLLRERFGKQLFINLPTFPENEYLIPPLTLQLLVENAVKHNVVSTKNPLTVDLIFQGDRIIVRNNFNPKIGDSSGTGVGLSNILKRHKLNNIKEPLIEQSATHFSVTIFLKLETSK